jgi:hypothetical protein
MSVVYDHHVKHVLYEHIGFAVSGIIMLFVLLTTQATLYRKTKRKFNIGFLIATVTTVLLIGYVGSTLVLAEKDLKLAKHDAFDSVNALWKAKAIAYDANNDESIYLLYNGLSTQQIYADHTFKFKVKQIDKLITDELNNITFEGEQEAATATMKTWKQYIAIDTKIRSLEQSGHYKEALALNIGTAQGESNWAFDQFDKSLTKTLEINNTAMEVTAAKLLNHLKIVPYVIGLAWLIIFTSCIFGMKPRLEEYK